MLYGFAVNEATWLYLSLLLIVAVFFRFGRIGSVRNLDLVLLLAISPGVLLVHLQNPAGYVWLFAASGALLMRLWCDGLFQRRPRVEPNLNFGGMLFLGAATFTFLMSIVVTTPPPEGTLDAVRRGDELLHRRDSARNAPVEGGPAASVVAASVAPLSNVVASEVTTAGGPRFTPTEVITARIMVIAAHAAVILGLFFVAKRHFGDPTAGVAMGTLYLLLPCTAFDSGRVVHVLPAAFIVWAFAAYRRPMAAGGLLGLACGTLFFPMFLVPLWAAFYGRRGAMRFGIALCVVTAVLIGSLALTSVDSSSFKRQVIGSIEWRLLEFRDAEAAGFWSVYDPAYRIPVVAAFAIMLVVLTVVPWKKNLEHLMAHSTAIVVGAQFWYPQQGSVYLLWYLPLLLMVVFRPRLAQLGPPEPPARESVETAAPARRELATAGAAARPLYR